MRKCALLRETGASCCTLYRLNKRSDIDLSFNQSLLSISESISTSESRSERTRENEINKGTTRRRERKTWRGRRGHRRRTTAAPAETKRENLHSKQTSLRYSCGGQIRTFILRSGARGHQGRRAMLSRGPSTTMAVRSSRVHFLERIHTRSWKRSGQRGGGTQERDRTKRQRLPSFLDWSVKMKERVAVTLPSAFLWIDIETRAWLCETNRCPFRNILQASLFLLQVV